MKTVLRVVLLGWLIPVMCPIGVLVAWLMDEDDPWGFGRHLAVTFVRGGKAADEWCARRWRKP